MRPRRRITLRLGREQRSQTARLRAQDLSGCISTALKTLHDAMMSALVTFQGERHGLAAHATFIAAYVKAHTDWQTAKNAASPPGRREDRVPKPMWKATKIKADSDFKAPRQVQVHDHTRLLTTTPDTTAPSAPNRLALRCDHDVDRVVDRSRR